MFFIFLLITALVLLLSGWIGALIGRSSRYLYLIMGFFLGNLPLQLFSLGYKILLLVLLMLLAFAIYTASKKRELTAGSHVPSTVSLSMSAFFIGEIIGLLAFYIL